jgi:hypothetical protein
LLTVRRLQNVLNEFKSKYERNVKSRSPYSKSETSFLLKKSVSSSHHRHNLFFQHNVRVNKSDSLANASDCNYGLPLNAHSSVNNLLSPVPKSPAKNQLRSFSLGRDPQTIDAQTANNPNNPNNPNNKMCRITANNQDSKLKFRQIVNKHRLLSRTVNVFKITRESAAVKNEQKAGTKTN